MDEVGKASEEPCACDLERKGHGHDQIYFLG